ncbi:MAG: T9SS type B sorting domain-containing protein [Bacteroidota bacterium]
MKKLFALFIILSLTTVGRANHLKGGWIQYSYLGPGAAANTSKYQITVRQYLDCGSSSGQRDASVPLGIFDGATNQLIRTVIITRSGTDNPNKTDYSPCLSSKPPVCYIIDIYTTTIDLPANTAGYTLTVQRCCRIQNIVNIGGNSNDYGLSYTTKIPGTINGVDYSNNKSPVFAQKDTVIVCFNAPFTFDFSATDADGDSLSYIFCDGLTGGFNNRNNPNDPLAAQPNPPSSPPYSPIPYSSGFSGSSPLGTSVTIDPITGIISGIAPSTTGDYVLSVCAIEFRNGVLIGSTKKEIHITVANCTISAASLKPSYVTCNGTTLTFQNESTSSNINSYLWDFGVPSITTDTSTSATPTYDYLKSGKDSGTYTVKLKVATINGCLDSTTSQVKVYPGFVPGFTVTGTCFLNNYLFSDTSKTKYGAISSRLWDFGDLTSNADTAHAKDSAWKYPAAATVQVKLIVANNVGCIDTVTRSLTIVDKPTLNLPFRDTLICSNDTLALRVNISNGSVLWTPSIGPNSSRILNKNTNSPLVFPRDTTKYYVAVNDNGCANTDSVTVNVLQFISVKAGTDTGICRTDTLRLNPVSYALSYVWRASTGIAVQNTKYPLVQPLVTTRYYVVANLGKCQARDSVLVKVAPYPSSAAGADVTICYGSRVQLTGTITGTVFSWSPTSSLINENTLTPIAGPTKTTAYVLSVTDTVGCPKPKTDTIIVTVIPPIQAFAGRDTSAVPNEPVQLNASGGTSYLWTPASYLNDPTLANPVALFDSNSPDSIMYTVKVSDGACSASDDVSVRIYKTGPDILVPSAFTPNGDGKNDVIRPILIGITKLNYFSIYNRWGQLLFSTTEINKGWDGNFSGIAQPSGAYVYQTQGVDFRGKAILRKGTVVLVR